MQHSSLPTVPHLGTYLSYTYLLTYYFTRRILCDSLFASPSPSPSPPVAAGVVLFYDLLLSSGGWNATDYCTLRLTVYSIHEAGRGERTKGRVRLFLFFLCSLSLFFFLSFSLSLRIVTRTRKRQIDRRTESLNSLRLASPRSWNSPACLKPPFFGLRPFSVFCSPLLLFFSHSPSINLSNNPEQANKLSIITTSNGHPTVQNRTLPPLANSARMPSG